MFPFRRRTPVGTGVVGIALRPGGLSFAHLVPEGEGPPRLAACEFSPCDTVEERRQALSQIVRTRGLAETPCVCVLDQADYQLRLVERPSVKPEELHDAVGWLLRDLMDLDSTEASFDICDFPEDATRGREPRIYVAAAHRQKIQEVTELVADSGLRLSAIDIPELALRNIAGALPAAVAGTATLQLEAKWGLLALSHEGNLYLARNIGTGFQEFESLAEDENAVGGESSSAGPPAPDALLLEIQRSLDYYESELGKTPVSRMIIAPCEVEPALLVPPLQEALRPVRVSVLDVSEVVRTEDPLLQELQAQSLYAIGAALRGGDPQQLNLKAISQAPPEPPISIYMTLRVCAATLLAMVLISGFGLWQLGRHRDGVGQLQGLRDARSRQLQSFEQQFPVPVLDRQLETRVRDLRRERKAKRQLLRALSPEQGAHTRGFSEFLAGFARRPVPGLWLTGISIRDGGQTLSLDGSALAPQRIPQLLQELGREPAFAGKRFAVLRMSISEVNRDAIDFSLDARPEPEALP